MYLRKLYHEINLVGKTIKSSKMQFVWELMLNSKAHKVELYHSKLSGKKKLCVDGRTLFQDQQRKNNLTHSFKIDSTHFTMVQLDDEEYDLRIDNRSFSIWLQEEKNCKLKPDYAVAKKPVEPSREEQKKFEQLPAYLRSKGASRDNDAKESSDFFAAQNEIKPARTTEVKQNDKPAQLLDFGLQPLSAQTDSKAQSIKTVQTFNHNKNILDNLNFFGEEQPISSFQPKGGQLSDGMLDVNYDFLVNSKEPKMNNRAQTSSLSAGNDYQNGIGTKPMMKSEINFEFPSGVNMNMNQGTINPSPYNNYPFNQHPQPQQQQHQQVNQWSQPPTQQPQLTYQQYQPQPQQSFEPQKQNLVQQQCNLPQPFIPNQASEYLLKYSDSIPIRQEAPLQPQQTNQYHPNSSPNEFKTKLISSGLVNIDNLLQDHKPSGFARGEKYDFDNSLKPQEYYSKNSNLSLNQDYDFNSQFQPSPFTQMNAQERTPFDF